MVKTPYEGMIRELSGCFYKSGVLFVGELTIRALYLGSNLRLLIKETPKGHPYSRIQGLLGFREIVRFDHGSHEAGPLVNT